MERELLLYREKAAKALVDEHLPKIWRVEMSNHKTSAGTCDDFRKIIKISKYFASYHSDAEFYKTVLHEIAHGLAGCWNSHNGRWARAFKELLVEENLTDGDYEPNVKMTADGEQKEQMGYKYFWVCHSCKVRIAGRHKLLKRFRCYLDADMPSLEYIHRTCDGAVHLVSKSDYTWV